MIYKLCFAEEILIMLLKYVCFRGNLIFLLLFQTTCLIETYHNEKITTGLPSHYNKDEKCHDNFPSDRFQVLTVPLGRPPVGGNSVISRR